jgi:hypothetical protein
VLLGLHVGYTLFVEDESARANALLSRGDMEGVMVVHLAGRSAEKLVMGEGEVRMQPLLTTAVDSSSIFTPACLPPSSAPGRDYRKGSRPEP